MHALFGSSLHSTCLIYFFPHHVIAQKILGGVKRYEYLYEIVFIFL
jgi:hypothetical protein